MDCDNHTPPFVGEIAEQLSTMSWSLMSRCAVGSSRMATSGSCAVSSRGGTRWRSPADTAAIGWSVGGARQCAAWPVQEPPHARLEARAGCTVRNPS